MGVKLLVDGKEIPLNEFAEKLLSGTIVGAMSSLRGIKEDWKKIEIEILAESWRCWVIAADLQWLYSYFNLARVRNMPPQYFIMISKTGALGLGEFPYPEWHKKEKENILSNVGIKVEYGEPAFEGEYKGTFRTVGDKEHVEIVRLYVEEGLGFNKIAEVLGRSSRTPLTQIQKHNRAVERSGFCPACRRFKSEYESQIASREQSYCS